MDVDAMNFVTMRHIERVRNLIHSAIRDLLKRAERHDQSKLESPEAEMFAEFTPLLSGTTYGSPEYQQLLVKLKPALDHHYANNRHHPEHHAEGVSDMTLVDLLEMFCDWKAASERHANGNILTSIEKNATRFSMSPQLQRIFHNTAKSFDFGE